MPDVAVEAGPCDEPASRAREQESDHTPEHEARNDHSEQIEFVSHATILLCSDSCGSYLGAPGKNPDRIPVSARRALLRPSPVTSCTVIAMVLSSCLTNPSGSRP